MTDHQSYFVSPLQLLTVQPVVCRGLCLSSPPYPLLLLWTGCLLTHTLHPGQNHVDESRALGFGQTAGCKACNPLLAAGRGGRGCSEAQLAAELRLAGVKWLHSSSSG